MLKLFNQCPACGGPVIITELTCRDCQLVLRGEFQPGQFSGLSDDQLTFIRAFLRVRGNLTELEKVLGVSYPTIRNKLDEINLALDRPEASPETSRSKNTAPTPANPPTQDDTRKAILQQVSAGELTVAEAMQKLRTLQGGK